VNASLLEHFSSLGYVPVVSPLAVDSHGDFLNCNADAVAGAIAASTNAHTLVLLSDVDQIRRDVNDPSTALLAVSVGEVRSLIESGAITGGMIPKIEAAVTAVEAGAARVIIANGSRSHGLRDAISGTVPHTEVVA
jgi:acetylglutamate kinase